MNNKPQYSKLDFTTRPGRLVSGNLATPSDKGYKGAQREVPQYFFALAVPKVPNPPRPDGSNPTLQQLTDIQNHIFQSYAGMGQSGAGVVQRMQSFPIGSTMPGGATAPFAWKIEDGDHPDNAGKEGWAGCWIYKFTTTFPFGVCDANNQQMDPATVKNGWWAEVAGNCVINGQLDHTAGLHLNPRFVRIVGYAPEIVGGPQADQVFTAPPAALPPGVSATPVAPQQAMPQQQAPVGNYQQPPAPAPTAAPQQAPNAMDQYQQLSGSYPPQAGQPGTPMQHAGGAMPASPSNMPPAPQPQAMPGNPAAQPTNYTPAPSPGAPAPAGGAPAAYAPQPGMPSGTAYPSNQPPAGVNPHPGFGGQQ